MKSITLQAPGMKFSSSFNTVVTKVINPEQNSSIVLDSLKNIELSLGDQSAASLGIEQDTQVTVRPVESSTKGEFVLEIGEKKKKPTSRTSGSSPELGQRFSNSLD